MKILKKIGKFTLLLLLINFNGSFAKPKIDSEIEWQISANGQILNKVQELTPFELVIVVNDYNGSLEPEFKGLERLIVIRKFSPEQIFTTFNRSTSRKTIYKFIVATPKTGVFNLGPIKIKTLRSKYESSDVVFEAVPRKNTEDQDVFFNISVDKTEAYVGEKLNFKVHFESSEDVKLEQIISEETKDIIFSNVDERTFKQTIDGKLKKISEVVGSLYIEKPGFIVIPPKVARYLDEKKLNNFFHFFMPTVTQKDLYSNILIIKVLPLPKNLNINGIGKFKSYDLRLSTTTAARGAPISLKLTIQGKGNIERVSWPTLELPEDLRAIESEEKFDKKKSKKTFEYVVQGLKEGNYQIPSQQFIYFDSNTKQTDTLFTKPLNVTIEPSNLQSLNTEDILEEQKDAKEKLQKDLLNKTWLIKLPAWIFWPLFLLPLIWILIQIMILCGQIFGPDLMRFFNRKIAFFKARNCLNKKIRLKRYDQLYDCFINLFVQRLNVNEQNLTGEFIVKKLRAANMDEVTLRKWQSFFDQLSGLKFSKDMASKLSLNNDSLMWLKKLELYI